jgi:hypothetical protein
MKSRKLRRQVIIREYDYHKVYKQAMDLALYDRGSFIPLNQENLEKIKLVDLLKGKTTPMTELAYDLKSPAILLYHLKDYLYSEKYYEWNVRVNQEGYVCVQPRKNIQESIVGWAVFEKDLVCRV